MNDAFWNDPYLDEEQTDPGGNVPSALAIEAPGKGRDHGHRHRNKPFRRLGPQLKIRLKHAKGITPRDILNEPLYLPVVLGDSFDVEETYAHEDYTTMAGEFSAPLGNRHSANLLTFSNDTMTCTWSPRWMTYRHQHPAKVRRHLERIGQSRRPFHLLGALIHSPNAKAEISCLATMRTLTRSVRHGEPDSRYITLEFRSYRRAALARRQHGGRGNRKLPAKHRLDAKDTWRSLAHDFYGHDWGWRDIRKANGLPRWGGSDPIVKSRKYKVGDVVRIPKVPPGEFGPGLGSGHGNGDGGVSIWDGNW